MHWVLDVAMGEENNRMRKGESAQNLALIRKLALHVLRQAPSIKLTITHNCRETGQDARGSRG